MKRELKPLQHEGDGFDSLESAIEFCKARPSIRYAEIGYRNQYHVFVAAFEHHFQFYHKVAIYRTEPTVEYVPYELQ